MKKIKQQEGFTLVEMLIVMAIIGILAAIAVPRFINMNTEAQIKACHSNVATLNTAIEMYKAKNEKDPAAIANLWTAADGGVLNAELLCPVTKKNTYQFITGSAYPAVECSDHGDAAGN
jgi:prepilin-type N-terminal cleavage/methylation domain-containing protein